MGRFHGENDIELNLKKQMKEDSRDHKVKEAIEANTVYAGIY